jgi:RNA polymerase sigma-32 factor
MTTQSPEYGAYLRSPELVAYLRVGKSTPAKWRLTGFGPPYTKLGRTILYRKRDVDEWVASRLRRSTSEKTNIGKQTPRWRPDQSGAERERTIMDYVHSAALSSNPVDNNLNQEPFGADIDHSAVYRDKIVRHPNLEADEELALVRRWREDRDLTARNKLINAHLKLALRMASKYRDAMDLDDLFSEATNGLIQATDAFDPDRGARFATCAQYWIKAALNQYVDRNRNIVKPRSGDKPLTDDSLNVTVDGGDEDADTFQDRLIDDRPDPQASLLEADFREHAVRVAKSALKDRDYQIFDARYLTDEPSTREELSSKLGISRERIRQIETRALERVQRAAKSFTARSTAASQSERRHRIDQHRDHREHGRQTQSRRTYVATTVPVLRRAA